MVKGVSRQVIVVHAPEPKLFEQAIFILKEDAVGEGITDDALLKEAQKAIQSGERPVKKRRLYLYGAVWAAGGALLTGLVWLGTVLLMRIGTIEVENPLFLAPMAGVTDWAFRTVCARLGAGVTVTEMVSSRALVYRDQKSAKLLRRNQGSVCGAQIFGNRFLATTPGSWPRRPNWPWIFPAVILSTSTWAAPCRRSPIPETDAA